MEAVRAITRGVAFLERVRRAMEPEMRDMKVLPVWLSSAFKREMTSVMYLGYERKVLKVTFVDFFKRAFGDRDLSYVNHVGRTQAEWQWSPSGAS